MKVLIYILITLFNFIYCICNYNISVLFFVSFFIIEFLSIILLKKININLSKKRLIISAILSIIILCLCTNNFAFGYVDKTITINN